MCVYVFISKSLKTNILAYLYIQYAFFHLFLHAYIHLSIYLYTFIFLFIFLYLYTLGCPQKHTFSYFDVRAFSISELDICKQILPFLFYFVFCKENRLSLASLDESYVEVLANTYAYVYESGISISKYICTLTVLPTGTLLGST